MEDDVAGKNNPVKLIRGAYKTLSKTQCRIADEILGHGESACFLSLNEFSSTVGVTPVTVINFCKRIGYGSFSSFKKDLQLYVQTMITPQKVVREDIDLYHGAVDADVAAEVVRHESSLLSGSFSALNYNDLLMAVNLLHSARKVFLIARGISLPVAEIFLTRLDFLCENAIILPISNPRLLTNRLSYVSQKDLFVFFSFPNYTPMMGNVAQCVKEIGSKIICITDKPASPPAFYADVRLLCQTSGFAFYNSMTVPTALVTVLASMLAIKKHDVLESKKSRLAEISDFFREK